MRSYFHIIFPILPHPSESKLFTGDHTSKDNHAPGPVITGASPYKRSKLSNSEAEIRESVREFQSLIVLGKKLDLPYLFGYKTGFSLL